MSGNSTAAAPRSGILDVWRALACLGVLWYHGVQGLVDSAVHPLLVPAVAIGKHGWLGVPVFFVISGYCIAATIERHAARGAGATRFWQDRLLRIYPVYWAAWLLAMGLAWSATLFNGLRGASAVPPSTHEFLANAFLITGWLGMPADLNVSWSLDFEMAFYVLIGGLLLFPRATPGRRLAAMAALTTTALTPLAAWLPVLKLWPQFACGIAAHATLNTALPRGARGGALTTLALFAVHSGMLGTWTDTVAPLTGLALAISLSLEARLPRPPRSVVSIGVASFSIYLVHLPLMSPALNLVHRRFAPTHELYPPLWLAHLGLGILGGLLLHHGVEKRWERTRSRLEPGAAPARLQTDGQCPAPL